jgi:hypothetical protein
LIPLTVKSILTNDRQDDSFVVDGHELHTVQVMGVISGREEKSTNIVFFVDDGTYAPLECRQWIDKDSVKHKKISEMRYIWCNSVI